MADFNQLVSSRHADAVRRVFGEDISISSVAPELLAAIILENDRFENLWPQRVIPWSTGPVGIAPALAGLGRMQIVNPAGGNLICVVQVFKAIDTIPNQSFDISADAPAIVGPPANNFARDSRVPGGTPITASLNFVANNLPAPAGILLDRQNAMPAAAGGTSFAKGDGPWLIAPGHRLDMQSRTVNQACTFVAIGYDRPARPEELKEL